MSLDYYYWPEKNPPVPAHFLGWWEPLSKISTYLLISEDGTIKAMVPKNQSGPFNPKNAWHVFDMKIVVSKIDGPIFKAIVYKTSPEDKTARPIYSYIHLYEDEYGPQRETMLALKKQSCYLDDIDIGKIVSVDWSRLTYAACKIDRNSDQLPWGNYTTYIR
jgi:hypothetical protein